MHPAIMFDGLNCATGFVLDRLLSRWCYALLIFDVSGAITFSLAMIISCTIDTFLS